MTSREEDPGQSESTAIDIPSTCSTDSRSAPSENIGECGAPPAFDDGVDPEDWTSLLVESSYDSAMNDSINYTEEPQFLAQGYDHPSMIGYINSAPYTGAVPKDGIEPYLASNISMPAMRDAFDTLPPLLPGPPPQPAIRIVQTEMTAASSVKRRKLEMEELWQSVAAVDQFTMALAPESRKTGPSSNDLPRPRDVIDPLYAPTQLPAGGEIDPLEGLDLSQCGGGHCEFSGGLATAHPGNPNSSDSSVTALDDMELCGELTFADLDSLFNSYGSA